MAVEPGSEAPLVLGTAGHIDHGKTALVTLLTGTNTDRLREERERGISIELGYAQLTLPSGRRLSVVDVPGHERFVRTMVAGATGVDLFLLVVAADDGVMPQTVEHLAIIELLGVRAGIVALTKIDLVDEELLELVCADVEQFLAGTRYAGAPVVGVSSRDGRGIPQLLGALEEVAAGLTAARREGPARLPVDRVFTLTGVGTVVTGTLWRGAVRAGDVLTVQPGGGQVTVRSVEVHDRAADAALAGQRTGVNLRGAQRAGLARGVWLSAPSPSAAATGAFDAWVSLLPGARPLRSGDRLRLHHGTAQHLARLQLLDRRELAGGEAAPVRVRLDDEVWVEPHDGFILRSLSPTATVGGGRVLDVVPRRWRDHDVHAAHLAAVNAGDVAQACALIAAERGAAGVAPVDLVTTALEPAAVFAALGAAEAGGDLERSSATGGSERWFVAGTLAGVRGALQEALARRASERPDRPGMPLVELAAVAAPFPAELLPALLGRLVADGAAVETESGFARADAGGALPTAQEELARRLAATLAAAGFSPPTLALLLAAERLSRRQAVTLLEVLARRGELVRVKEDLWFSAAAVGEARERLLAALARRPQITLAEFRDLLSTGRRNAQALLEYFDREGLTRRVGEARVLRGRR